MTVRTSRFEFDIQNLRRVAEQAGRGLLDGRAISRALLDEVAGGVELLAERDLRPHLCVVRVGDDPASEIYVKHKIRACDRVGIVSSELHLPADISQEALLGHLTELSDDPDIHAILLQLPLSEHLDADEAILAIDPDKDVDGFHPANLGMVMTRRGEIEPCTPRGIITMLEATGVKCEGKCACVVGRSAIVGRPMAQMLIRANATVTVCHRHTLDLAEYVRAADIVVVATGVPELIEGDWIKPGAVVIDVGITRTEGGGLVGDVEFDAAREKASLITPVPGGVGPMTVATLMENTLRATCLQHDLAIWDGELVVGVDSV